MTTQTLAFLPGWGFKASVWTPITNQLTQYANYHCDLPAPDYHDTLKTIIDKLNRHLPDNASLVGWSLGGLLAIALCAAYPAKYQRLILVASASKFEPAPSDSFLEIAASNLPYALTQFKRLACFPNKDTDLRTHLDQHAIQDAVTLQFYLRLLFTTDLSVALNNLTQPVLQLAGSRDAIWSAHSSSQIIAASGHTFFLTHPALFIQHLISFIN